MEAAAPTTPVPRAREAFPASRQDHRPSAPLGSGNPFAAEQKPAAAASSRLCAADLLRPDHHAVRLPSSSTSLVFIISHFLILYNLLCVRSLMEVTLLDGTFHEVDPNDVALLSQHIEISMPVIRSEDSFSRFRRFMNMHQHEETTNVTEEWDAIFTEEIKDTDTLHDLLMLASITGQEHLMNILFKRTADMLKKRLPADVAELLNLPYDNEEENVLPEVPGDSDGEDDGTSTDANDGDGGGGDDEENVLPPEVPGDGAQDDGPSPDARNNDGGGSNNGSGGRMMV
ncbi:hypothetical protein EJB05_00811 [Eragrostis curvula]|uniref:SKP1 component dimerisation domain-containing protein n=1 Tax=Eragrostis curvula TaxID=38414 RepID=A0A5J9WMP6_9POAL|nr:hypothetical protein EJB05_00811 [Eragrostis curvula]